MLLRPVVWSRSRPRALPLHDAPPRDRMRRARPALDLRRRPREARGRTRSRPAARDAHRHAHGRRDGRRRTARRHVGPHRRLSLPRSGRPRLRPTPRRRRRSRGRADDAERLLARPAAPRPRAARATNGRRRPGSHGRLRRRWGVARRGRAPRTSFRERPGLGEHVAWAESNAIVFANSVLGARTGRYGDFIDICCAITGRAPAAGLHLDDERLARAVFRVQGVPAALLEDEAAYAAIGHLVGRRTGSAVPAIVGLPRSATEDHLKALGRCGGILGRGRHVPCGRRDAGGPDARGRDRWRRAHDRRDARPRLAAGGARRAHDRSRSAPPSAA